ncbi:hypothetical protein [Gallaecimonas xiamenensis]|uniref:Uncharacterized protein n=1 Tax=Gallaecimonas xiamenensis 3-C-1 TaxID=745411 RepID=K2IE50_9GAMM|nr:hypothetical protein [Gallaecimonas xiamenensis]EKE68291.1 hypothetical protein B3C1_17327 [Gallaecimonas xiamenensis 3-C-1]
MLLPTGVRLGLLSLVALAWWPVHHSDSWLAHGFLASALICLLFNPVLALRICAPVLCLSTLLSLMP